jgi:NADH-quinone oxidoreductase subunit N
VSNQPAVDLGQLAHLGPVLIILATVLVLLVAEVAARALRRRQGLGLVGSFAVSMVGTGLAAVYALVLWRQMAVLNVSRLSELFFAQAPTTAGMPPAWRAGALAVDYFSVFAMLVVCGIVLLVSLNLLPYLRRHGLHRAELFPLLLLSASGMMLLGMSRDLLVTFVSIEIVSLPLYVLCGLDEHNRANQESSLKYFLLGSFASGFFIYGAALVYGAVGHLNYSAISHFAGHAVQSSTILLVGIALVGGGLAFKLALVPFHAWVPDVYQGAPTPITGFMATGVKLGVFAAALRLILEALPPVDPAAWRAGLVLLAALSMAVGNVLALHQMSAKRLLAYSAIAHTGYIAVGLAAGSASSAASIMVYLVGYSLAALGAFVLISYLAPGEQDDIYIDEMHDLAKRAPVSSVALAILLLSMAGFPVTVGFIGKLLVFTDAWRAGLYGLVIFAVLNSVVSVYYYLRFVLAMYMQPRAPGAAELALARMPTAYVITGVVTVGLTLLYGVMPYALIGFTQYCQLGGF